VKILVHSLLLMAPCCALAQATPGTWHLPKKPANPVQTSQAHVLLGSATPRIVRVCYLTGPDDTAVAVRANIAGGANQTSNIYKGGCADVGGTDVEITNPNSTPVSGTYGLLPNTDKQSGPL
jgi:hypothetical protein